MLYRNILTTHIFISYLRYPGGSQFPSTKWWLTGNIITVYAANGKIYWMGSNIHQVPASQANNNHFGTRVNIMNVFTVCNHVVKDIRVNNNLGKNIRIISRENSQGKHVHSICRGREHPRIIIIGGSNICFYRIEHESMMQTGTDFWCGQVWTKCYKSGVT